MAIPTVYRSTDSGAPVLSSATADSAITLLRACLVDGYGAQAPAGWTEPFTATNKAVFRGGSAGTGAFIRVEAFTSARGPFSLRGYRTMSDIDTGEDATAIAYGWRNLSNNAAAQDWVLVATPTSFHFSAGLGVDRAMLCGAGDLLSMSDGDAYRNFVYGVRNTSWQFAPPFLGTDTSGDAGQAGGWGAAMGLATGLYLGRDHTGLGGSIGAGLLRPHIYAGSGMVGGSQFPSLPSSNAANSALMPAYVIHGSGAAAVIRGRLPGLYVPLFNILGAAVGAENLAVAGPGSTTLALRASSSWNQSGLLVETALDWGD